VSVDPLPLESREIPTAHGVKTAAMSLLSVWQLDSITLTQQIALHISIILIWVYNYNESSGTTPDGLALMTTRTLEEEEPDLGKFLELLEREIAAHPKHIRPLGSQRAARIELLVRGVPVDLEDPLPFDEK
jgi:hypothetical protein